MSLLANQVPKKTGQPKNVTTLEATTLLSLWTLGNQESYRGIADRFGMGVASSHFQVIKCCISLCNIINEFIKWPHGAQAVSTIERFDSLRGAGNFSDVIGCIDGTHIAITAPNAWIHSR